MSKTGHKKINRVSAYIIVNVPNPGHICEIFGGTNSGLANLFEGTCPLFSTNFSEILARFHMNFEEQNNVLEASIIIINYCIIFISVYCN